MANIQFNEPKATQAAAFLLKLGGQMSYLKLIKLLYIVDREALLRWGRPVTTDRYVSMDRGPVLSRTLTLITEEVSPNTRSVWSEHISEPEHYEVRLLADADMEELSEAEVGLIEEVYSKFETMSRWQLVNLTHDYSEWKNPNGSAVPIQYCDILRAGGKTEAEVAAIVEDLEELASADAIFSR